MHPRIPALALASALLLCAAGASVAATSGSQPARSDNWTPPALPAPPAPPAPPSPPALPAPPAPPALPAVPEKAHAACAGKAAGSHVSVDLGPRETMGGRCERVDGKMVFRLRSYEKH